MTSLFDLSGKIALVTGATKGIGRGVADRLAEHGARVIVSSRDAKACDEVAEEINQSHGGGQKIAAGIACDLEQLEDIEQLADQAGRVFGGLDILVCNAAILPFMGPSADTPPALFDRILTSNQHHNFRLCQGVRGALAQRGGGSIVLIGSVAGHTASPELMAYAIAKAGVAHMARCLADEFAADGIRVNCVSPGLVRSYSSTPVWEDEAVLDHVTSSIPLRRIGEPDDIAGAVIFLSSVAGSYVTGTMIPVDGGRVHLSTPDSSEAVMDLMDSTEPLN
jgi:NAD(P)-dependent dehydrogenase (short-subunit alcohol dehydrogenase family)